MLNTRSGWLKLGMPVRRECVGFPRQASPNGDLYDESQCQAPHHETVRARLYGCPDSVGQDMIDTREFWADDSRSASDML